jgi:hypothetical protein
MPQPDFASQTAIERLREEIAYSRERIARAMQLATPGPVESERVGRLFQVFKAVGEA